MEVNSESVDQVVELITTYGMSVLGGLVILVIGWIAANWIGKLTSRLLGRSKRVETTLQSFLSGLVKYAILAFVIIAVLNQFGVQTTSLIAVFGAAGLAIGLALQGTLSNVAAGTMLMIFRPLKVDQYVEVAGKAGTVKSIGLFTTELATPDNVQIIIPNSSVWGSSVVNYSHHATRRVDFTLGIGYGDDIEKAMQVIQKTIDADERTHKEPEPQIVVGNLGESSVDIIVRVWTDAATYWPLKFDLTRAFKLAFDDNGISIPYPQRDLHLFHKADFPIPGMSQERTGN